ncbi:hypothetical protein GUITHDRAFT_120882 [Guillardia theta CCMP2712]|uniref:Uncharacterized protein n=1 Tax=Guillardia theta (strain CCMP2712) TaxID=905079 RepID=L1I9K6_GUITC|nr:hypothetical protein GUITHDRAFT_120882 [Guillardia theta CCMP2712]EKX32931.1 hypothetical protein GUITHDRAFT_120882 [Guillardia theta CCMP2712]|eukprot:XP_005819911.1 hypothetical protein GUITHDRAFT_120882 [Guillardia theta CCMP2712]
MSIGRLPGREQEYYSKLLMDATDEERKWVDIRKEWLRKSSEFDLQLEATKREEKLKMKRQAARSSGLSFEEIEQHIVHSTPFPKPIPLATLVSVMTEIWDD